MKRTIIQQEIVDLVRSYCGKKLVTRFLADQRKFSAMAERLLQSPECVAAEIKCSQNHEIEYLDHLLTLCKQSLQKYEYQEMLIRIGNIFKLHGELHLAERTFAEAIRQGDAADCAELRAEALLLRGEVFSRQGRWQESNNDLEASRSLFADANDAVSLARVENIMGTTLAEQGRINEAGACFSRALKNSDGTDQRVLSATIWMNLGILQNILGNWDEALNHHTRALSLFEQAGDLVRIAEVHHNRGMSYLSKNDLVSAGRAFDTSLDYSTKMHNPGLIGLAKLGKATMYLRANDLPMALALCNQAQEHFATTNDRLSIADQYKVKGMIFREMKEYDVAALHFNSSLRINEELNNMLNLGETLFEVGLMERRRRRKAEARASFQRARLCLEKVGARIECERVLNELTTLENTRS